MTNLYLQLQKFNGFLEVFLIPIVLVKGALISDSPLVKYFFNHYFTVCLLIFVNVCSKFLVSTTFLELVKLTNVKYVSVGLSAYCLGNLISYFFEDFKLLVLERKFSKVRLSQLLFFPLAYYSRYYVKYNLLLNPVLENIPFNSLFFCLLGVHLFFNHVNCWCLVLSGAMTTLYFIPCGVPISFFSKEIVFFSFGKSYILVFFILIYASLRARVINDEIELNPVLVFLMGVVSCFVFENRFAMAINFAYFFIFLLGIFMGTLENIYSDFMCTIFGALLEEGAYKRNVSLYCSWITVPIISSLVPLFRSNIGFFYKAQLCVNTLIYFQVLVCVLFLIINIIGGIIKYRYEQC